MSDLIDRRKVLNWLENYKFEFCAEVGKEREYNFVENLIKGIENEPTAYDVEQVVKELESRAEANEDVTGRLKGIATKRQRDSWLARASAFRKAIEIVKGGGVNEV